MMLCDEREPKSSQGRRIVLCGLSEEGWELTSLSSKNAAKLKLCRKSLLRKSPRKGGTGDSHGLLSGGAASDGRR